jgi:hypothetical protein
LAGMIGVQSLQSVLPEALLPANDGGRRGLELSLEGVEGRAFRQRRRIDAGDKSATWALLAFRVAAPIDRMRRSIPDHGWR